MSTYPHAKGGLPILRKIGLGLEAGMISNVKFGVNEDVDAAEDVWDGGGDYTGQPTTGSAETLDIYSSNDADNGATATGALTMRVYGLDGDYTEIFEDVTLNGTTVVTTTQTFWRCYRAVVLSAGSGGENAGIITVEHTTTSANVFAKVQIGYNQSLVAAITIPANMSMLVVAGGFSAAIAAGGTQVVGFSFRVRPFGGVYNAAFHGLVTDAYQYREQFATGLHLPAKTDIKVRVDHVSSANAEIEAHFEYICVDI